MLLTFFPMGVFSMNPSTSFNAGFSSRLFKSNFILTATLPWSRACFFALVSVPSRAWRANFQNTSYIVEQTVVFDFLVASESVSGRVGPAVALYRRFRISAVMLAVLQLQLIEKVERNIEYSYFVRLCGFVQNNSKQPATSFLHSPLSLRSKILFPFYFFY